MIKPLVDSTFKLPADGLYQVVPIGEFPITAEVIENGKPVKRDLVQVCDRRCTELILNRFRAEAAEPNFAGLLVDYDHFSLDTDKSSRAAGWAVELQNRADGLYSQIRWSASGENSVTGGDFRFPSPVFDPSTVEWLGANRFRPTHLLSIGVTNDPRMKGVIKPLSNRGGGTAGTQGKDPNMALKEQLCQALGLPPETADEAVMAKVQELAGRAKEVPVLKNRVSELEKTQLEAAVEKDLTEFAGVIQNRDEVKKQLLANREGTLLTLKALKPAPAAPEKKELTTALPNRRSAADPAKAEGDQPDETQQRRLAAKIRNRAAEIQKTQRVSRTRAWDLAKAEMEKAE